MVSDISINTPNNRLFFDGLPAKTRVAFLGLAKFKPLVGTKWYLAGGTALALQVGHRQSVDLDFFTPNKTFDITDWETVLFAAGHWETSHRAIGTLYGTFLGAKVSFIAYPFFKPSEFLKYGNLKIVKPHDIAAMKIIAVSQRGRKRDFVDLYWYCQNREPLEQVLERTIQQYPYQNHNIAHFLTSLTYFADAELDPMPQIFFQASWMEIKKYFRREVPVVTKKILHLK